MNTEQSTLQRAFFHRRDLLRAAAAAKHFPAGTRACTLRTVPQPYEMFSWSFLYIPTRKFWKDNFSLNEDRQRRLVKIGSMLNAASENKPGNPFVNGVFIHGVAF